MMWYMALLRWVYSLRQAENMRSEVTDDTGKYMSNIILTVCGPFLKQQRFGDRRLVESYISNLTFFGQITKGNFQLSNHFYAALAIFFCPETWGAVTTKLNLQHPSPLCVPPMRADITRHIRKHRERRKSKEGSNGRRLSQKDYYTATTQLQYTESSQNLY